MNVLGRVAFNLYLYIVYFCHHYYDIKQFVFFILLFKAQYLAYTFYMQTIIF